MIALHKQLWDYFRYKVYKSLINILIDLIPFLKLSVRSWALYCSECVLKKPFKAKLSGNKIAMLILNCETEPVAKTEEFNKLIDVLTSILIENPAGNYRNGLIVYIQIITWFYNGTL